MLLSYALDAGRHGHGMDELCNLHLEHCPIAFKDICGTGKSQITFDKVPLDRSTCYAAEDADVTLRLWRRLKPRLTRSEEHTSELQSLMRISYAVFCLKKNNTK